MSDLSPAENTVERAHWTRLLEMYVPVRSGRRPHHRRRGVLPAARRDRRRSATPAPRRGLVAGAGHRPGRLLYGIVKQGSDTIARQEAALTHQVGELSALLGQNAALSEQVRAAADEPRP